MPRHPRRNVPGFVYHLISRFVDREWFITSNEERTRYLTLLGRAIERSDWRCLAFGVMSSHIHLGVIAGDQPLDMWARRAHGPFADWMNRRHDRIGTMFVRGPKDYPVAPHRVRDLIAYIHNNPVEAGVAASAVESTWTSHRAYVGRSPAPRWLDISAGLARSGFASVEALGRWVATAKVEAPHDRPDPEWQFGSATSRCTPPRHGRPMALEILKATAAELQLTTDQVCSQRRGRLELRAREIAVRAAARLGLRGSDIAAILEITQQGASKILLRPVQAIEVEDGVTRVVARVSDDASCASCV